MRPLATNIAWCVCLSVCLCVYLLGTSVSRTKTAEPIEILFWLWTRVGPTNHVLGAGVHWCGNAVERRSGKYFGAGTALRQTGGTLTLKRSGKSRRTR